jgi:hypothetical protein
MTDQLHDFYTIRKYLNDIYNKDKFERLVQQSSRI